MIVSNPTTVEVVLSCIEVVVGVLTIITKVPSLHWLIYEQYVDRK